MSEIAKFWEVMHRVTRKIVELGNSKDLFSFVFAATKDHVVHVIISATIDTSTYYLQDLLIP